MQHRISNNILKARRTGASLIVVLITMTIVSFFIASMLVIFSSNDTVLKSQTESKKMYYYARSGINILEAAIVNQGDKVFKGLASNPILIEEKLDRNKLKGESAFGTVFADGYFLPSDIEITLKVEYLDEAKARLISPPKNPSDAPKYTNFLMITSEAKNKVSGMNAVLVKYLDPDGIKSEYQ